MADPPPWGGPHSSLDARSHFPRQTWALAFHRGTMKQALAPFCFTLLQCSAHLRLRSRSRWASRQRLVGLFCMPLPDARERRLPRVVVN